MSKDFNRKELRQDVFVASSLNAIEWIRKHREKVVKYGSVVMIAALVFAIWRFQSLKAEHTVSGKLFAIMSLYRQGTEQADEENIRLCRETAEAYPKSGLLDAILFYEGNCLFRLGRFDEALKVYDDFVTRYPDHDHKSLVESDRANVYEEMKEYEKARDILGVLLESPNAGYMRAKLTLDLARIERLLNNPDRARELYDQIIKDYGGSDFAAMAKSQKDFL